MTRKQTNSIYWHCDQCGKVETDAVEVGVSIYRATYENAIEHGDMPQGWFELKRQTGHRGTIRHFCSIACIRLFINTDFDKLFQG